MKNALPVMTCLTLALAASQATAQISTDATLGREPQELQGPNFAVGSELGRIRDQNLFHSFERFSLGTGESATFSGPDAIRNVISRVTGGERSEIDGTIASTIDGADFYFINPAGVLFGPNASLDVPGSVHVATANELGFADGAAFSASEPAASTLTVASPEAFGFLDRGAGSITLDRTQELLVAPDRSLSLVGGDVRIDGTLIELRDFERNGNVTLVAMSRFGTVAVADGRTSAAPRGGISVTGSVIDVSSAAGGGVVRIRAGALAVDSAGIFADSEADEPGPATALIDIEADRVELTNFTEVASVAFGAGDAGDITVTTGELKVLSGASLRSDTESAGDAGDVSVLDARHVLVSREGLDARTDISSSVATLGDTDPREATGDAGIVTVEADEVTVRDSGAIFSISRGAGDGGTVAITADRIELRGGGQIGSGTIDLSTGRGGNVAVTSREELTISGQSRQINPRTGRPEPSGIFVSSESEAEAAGRAGQATVSAPVIRIANRGEISSESVSNESSGELLVSAEQVVIDDGEITTIAEGAGDGGRIEVRAGVIELRNGGLISAQSTGSGNAGSVTITAPDGQTLDRLTLDQGRISTSSQQAGGGQITIQVRELIDLQDSRIESSVAQAAGNAGDITIDPDFLVLDDSQILARADAGVGGDISIVADNLVLSPDSLINAEAGEEGVDGTVSTSEPAVDLASALVVLAAPPLDADALLREPCALRRDVGASSFTGAGRGGLPAAPDRPLGSAYRPPAEAQAAPGDASVRPAALTLAIPCSNAD